MVRWSKFSRSLIQHHHWDNLAAMETAYTKIMADPEWQALGIRINMILKDNREELLATLP